MFCFLLIFNDTHEDTGFLFSENSFYFAASLFLIYSQKPFVRETAYDYTLWRQVCRNNQDLTPGGEEKAEGEDTKFQKTKILFPWRRSWD